MSHAGAINAGSFDQFIWNTLVIVTEDQGANWDSVNNMRKDQNINCSTNAGPLVELGKWNHDCLVRNEHTEQECCENYG